MKPLTKETALTKVAAKCATREYCISDIEKSLKNWGIQENEIYEIVDKLIESNFINESRYAAAFVHDKVEFDHWGRMKIIQALKIKGIKENIINEAINNIDNNSYQKALKIVISSKLRSLAKEADDYQQAIKLTKYAMGRGFEFELIKKCIDLEIE